MRYRPLLLRVAPFRRLRRSGSSGLLGPFAIAAVLAVAGSQLEETVRQAPALPAGTAAAATPALGVADFPERVVRGTTLPRTGTVAAPAATKATARRTSPRATRTRTARAAAPRKAWVRPCRGPLTSYYGMRWGRMHRGLDFGCSYGAPIYAASSGTVTFSGAQGGYGRLITIRHAGGWVTAYGHMSRLVVRSGQRVSAGQLIAYVGSAGHSTGPHLHFEVRTGGGGTVNPLAFMRERGVRL